MESKSFFFRGALVDVFFIAGSGGKLLSSFFFAQVETYGVHFLINTSASTCYFSKIKFVGGWKPPQTKKHWVVLKILYVGSWGNDSQFDSRICLLGRAAQPPTVDHKMGPC